MVPMTAFIWKSGPDVMPVNLPKMATSALHTGSCVTIAVVDCNQKKTWYSHNVIVYGKTDVPSALAIAHTGQRYWHFLLTR